MQESNNIMVSVVCLAYNHEKYIRKMLEGLVMQETSFRFQIIIHDDASTDETPLIIKEFEERYPNIIIPIYQKENQYSKGIPISAKYIYPICKGKYITFCEGDDFWTDKYKLEKQVKVLENNPQCSMSLHKVAIVDETSKETGKYFPRYELLKTGVVSKAEFLSLVVYTRTLNYLQFQLSSCMLLNKYLQEFVNDPPEFKRIADVGDLPLFLYMGMVGDIYYLEDEMSCYRSGVIGSWNYRNRSVEKRCNHLEIECKVLESFNMFSGGIIEESVNKGIRNRQFGMLRLKHDIKNMKRKEMKEFYKMLSLKAKCKEHLLAYVDKMMSIFMRIVL